MGAEEYSRNTQRRDSQRRDPQRDSQRRDPQKTEPEKRVTPSKILSRKDNPLPTIVPKSEEIDSWEDLDVTPQEEGKPKTVVVEKKLPNVQDISLAPKDKVEKPKPKESKPIE